MTMERIWAGWRSEYVGGAGAEPPADECLFCRLAAADAEAQLSRRQEELLAAVRAASARLKGTAG